jgi:DASS family divalent anion:Na+ symporter
MNAAQGYKLGSQLVCFALALGIWFAPVPAGLTREAWHLFAVFAAAILSVILNAFPLLTASLLAIGAVLLTGTVDPVRAFAGSAVLLVVVAFLVANAVVKCGLGRRISLFVVTVFGRSTLGLGVSIFLTDALIAPAFPSNTARAGLLYPIILSCCPTEPRRHQVSAGGDGSPRLSISVLYPLIWPMYPSGPCPESVAMLVDFREAISGSRY